MEVRALMSATSSGNAFDLRCNVREGLITFLQKSYPDSFPLVRLAELGKNEPPRQDVSAVKQPSGSEAPAAKEPPRQDAPGINEPPQPAAGAEH
jgi:hypothetical protein